MASHLVTSSPHQSSETRARNLLQGLTGVSYLRGETSACGTARSKQSRNIGRSVYFAEKGATRKNNKEHLTPFISHHVMFFHELAISATLNSDELLDFSQVTDDD